MTFRLYSDSLRDPLSFSASVGDDWGFGADYTAAKMMAREILDAHQTTKTGRIYATLHPVDIQV